MGEASEAGSATPATAPPAWYPTEQGLRWWDGQAWGPLAPGASPTDEVSRGKTLAVISHLGMFAGGFVLPLIIRLTEGKTNDYVKHHATEALNFSITFMIGWLTGFALLFTGAVASSGDRHHSASGWFVLPFLAMFALMILGWVFAILGAVRASQGVWWRYPINIRFVRGARANDL